MKKKHTSLQDSVRGYIREISVAMCLQIQTYIYICCVKKQYHKKAVFFYVDIYL